MSTISELRTEFKAAAIGMAFSAGTVAGLVITNSSGVEGYAVGTLALAFFMFTADRCARAITGIKKSEQPFFAPK